MHAGPPLHRIERLILSGLVCASLAACALPEPQADFDSADPGERVRAIAAAAEEGDDSTLPELIDCLGSDDPAVRLLAIGALTRISGGETFGYEYAAEPQERTVAVARWRDWASIR